MSCTGRTFRSSLLPPKVDTLSSNYTAPHPKKADVLFSKRAPAITEMELKQAGRWDFL
jgi:hypothetical protein